MTHESIGLLSGALVLLSIVPYAFRTCQGKIRPVPTSWALWSFIGLAIILTYKSSGATANLWPALFGFTNPTLITILSLWQQKKYPPASSWKRPNLAERLCFLFGIVSLALWLFLRRTPALSQYALYVAIVADLCAALPTIFFVWKQPDGDRPLAWLIFGVGYFLAIFAAPHETLADWGLPLYMTAVSFNVALPLAIYRARNNIPFSEWI